MRRRGQRRIRPARVAAADLAVVDPGHHQIFPPHRAPDRCSRRCSPDREVTVAGSVSWWMMLLGRSVNSSTPAQPPTSGLG